MDERSYNTPTFDKDPDYTECENCDGTGFVYVNDSDVPEDKQLIKEVCPKCDEGWILID